MREMERGRDRERERERGGSCCPPVSAFNRHYNTRQFVTTNGLATVATGSAKVSLDSEYYIYV